MLTLAMSEKPETQVRMRALMPAGFIGLLAERTGVTDPAAISKLVNLQQTKSQYWPAVEALAHAHNPEGFATWQAQQA